MNRATIAPRWLTYGRWRREGEIRESTVCRDCGRPVQRVCDIASREDKRVHGERAQARLEARLGPQEPRSRHEQYNE